MPQLTSTQSSLILSVAKGNSLIVRNRSGVETVTGSSVAREDATAVLGSGAYVYGPQTSASTLTISTTGVCDYDIVAGDPTPATEPARVVRSAATGAPASLIDPATGQPVGAGGGVGGLLSMFSRPSDSISKTVTQEYQSVASGGGTLTLIDTTSTPGSGVVDMVQVIASSPQGGLDARLAIYVDGESTPSLDCELQCFGSFFQQAPTIFSVPHFRVGRGSTGLQYWIKWPIPYSKSIRIVLTNSSTTTTTYWCAVNYSKFNHTIPYRLKCSARGYVDRLQNVTPAQQYDRTVKFLDLPSGAGNVGYVVGFTYAAFNVSSTTNRDSYLENNIVLYHGTEARDGSVVPSWNSTGTEDFLMSAFYFDQGEGSFGDIAVTSRNRAGNGNTTVIADLWSAYGGIRFTDGCLLAMEQGKAVTPGVSSVNIDLGYQVLYYVGA